MCRLVLFLIISVIFLFSRGDALKSRISLRPLAYRRLSSGVYSTATESPADVSIEENVIKITPKAMKHISELKAKMNDGKNCLRMGVKAGGCSGMSYVMDFCSEAEITADDHIEEYDSIKCVVDPKSLLYLYGLQLDYSDELIGGGFKFSNPNAETSCGCGKSFGV
jgi:iron-sulfur cluster assembly accessory protein